jgi:phosphate uptake regulator
MKRKLVKQGAATMMISLPSKWIKDNKLDKGDEIELEEKENSLLISLNQHSKLQETRVNLKSSKESSIRTILTNIYRQGFDKVSVSYQGEESLKTIEKVVENQLLGFEIIKKTSTQCVIENITEPSKEQFKNIFSKMISNIEELLELTKRALSGDTFSEFEEIETKIKEFDNFCRRIVSKETLEKEDIQIAFHQELIHAQRNLYYLLKTLNKTKIKYNKSEISLLEKCHAMFELLLRSYNDRKLETIEQMHTLQTETYEKGYSLFIKSDCNPIVIYNLLNTTRGFYLASSPLIGLCL